MLKKLFVLLLSVSSLYACSQAQTKTEFGEKFDATDAISYDQLVERMDGKESADAIVTATVGEVCQVKGCWMTLIPEKADLPPMRVTFKDYAFFMPKDLSGKKVTVNGKAFIETTSVDDLRHYAEDAGKSKDEIALITEPKRELTFEAAGVKIVQ